MAARSRRWMGNYYVLAEDGTVGFAGTMKDPDRLDRQVASDLLSFMIELLAHDQEVDRTRNGPAWIPA